MNTDPVRRIADDVAAIPGSVWRVDAAETVDVSLCGGKAAGLATLQRAGFAVPTAVCLTTQCYRRWLEASGLAPLLASDIEDAATPDPVRRRTVLATMRARIETAKIADDLIAELEPEITRVGRGDGRLAVRSSAPYEDHADASHAGIHTSVVVEGDDLEAIVSAVKTCWASLWTEAAWTYRERLGIPHGEATMAVVVQRFISADWSGVAFSADPLTHDRTTVVIEAGRSTGASVVSGRLTPDLYHVSLPTDGGPAHVRRRPGASGDAAPDAHRAAEANGDGRPQMGLAESRVLELARLVKAVERACGMPSDVEWVFDGRMFWAVQARPISAFDAPGRPTPPAQTLWTRANLKEVFPDLPSPLA